MLKQQIMILYHDSKIQGNLIGVRSDPLKNTWSIEWFYEVMWSSLDFVQISCNQIIGLIALD